MAIYHVAYHAYKRTPTKDGRLTNGWRHGS